MKISGDIRNIIFDLGGVIINIDFQLTYEAFARLTNTDILTVLKEFKEKQVFLRYEKGELNDGEFRDLVRSTFKTDLSDADIDQAWNALLLDLPKERVELIKSLHDSYNVYLLSNTNRIHIVGVNKILYASSGVKDLKELFIKAYYSYEMGLAKPDVEIYRQVLRENNLNPEETVFIDDSLDNIKGAEKAGLLTRHLVAPETILDYLGNGRK